LDSTNNQAKKLIDDGKIISVNKYCITADSQTSGRGRSGKVWSSDDGNLFCSLILDATKIEEPHILSYVAALAISGFLKENSIDNQIKWPNDILIKGRKISGILLEIHKDFLIIGIGINVKLAPQIKDIEVTSIEAEGYKTNKESVLISIIRHFEHQLNIFLKNGFDGGLRAELNNKLFKESKVTTTINNQKIEGDIIEVDKSGNLIVKTSKAIEKINTGEIFFS